MSRTILLADDSLTIQKVVELTFADTDYEVVAVSSGDDLLRQLPECRPDLVICDVIMPGTDGYDVCQEIKLSADFLHVPVILLTGTFEPFDRDRALAVGCSEIITKPFEARKLVEAVDRLYSAAGVASPPVPPTAEAAALDVEVTPPPPMDAPEEAEIARDEMELEDTAVTADDESSDTGSAGTSTDDDDVVILTKEEIAEETQDEPNGFELVLDEPAAEGEPPAFPEVLPPAAEVISETPIGAETVAAIDFLEAVETTEDEVVADHQQPGPAEDPFPAEAGDEEVFPYEELEQEESAAVDEYVDSTKTTPINVDAVMAEGLPDGDETGAEIEDESTDVESTDVDMSDADTQDLTEKVSLPESTDEPASTGLSDEDVDRIARRVLELAGDRIEHIAWDVIPDMAELVVRERVREIEAAAGSD
jgi:CheY-like chemotaxis protein